MRDQVKMKISLISYGSPRHHAHPERLGAYVSPRMAAGCLGRHRGILVCRHVSSARGGQAAAESGRWTPAGDHPCYSQFPAREMPGTRVRGIARDRAPALMPPRMRTGDLGQAHRAARRERAMVTLSGRASPKARGAASWRSVIGAAAKPEWLPYCVGRPSRGRSRYGPCPLFGSSPSAGDAIAAAAAPRLRQFDGGLQGGRGHL